MAAKKISQLPAAAVLAGSELVPVVQGGVTVGATATQIVAAEVVRALAAENLVESGAAWTGGSGLETLARNSAGTPRWSPKPLFPVDDYLVGGLTDSGAAAAALAAAIANPRGGTVEFSPRAYALGNLEMVVPAGLTKVVNIKGQGMLSTRVNFTTDRGAGTWSIRADSDATAGGNCYSVISDMNIVGPTATTALGGIPSTMRAIRQTRRMHVERCAISGFHTGIQVAGDHTVARDLVISGCYYSMYFAEMSIYFGDNLIENCDLSGTLFASIGIANNVLASFNMVGGHLGVGPYCVYVEAGSTASLSLGGVSFLRTSFELAGNGWIYSPDKTARLDGVDFIGCGFSRSVATYKLAANPADYGFYVAEMHRINFQGSILRDAFAQGQIFTNSFVSFSMDRAETAWDACVAAGIPLLLASGTVLAVEVSSWRFRARGLRATSAILKGQLVGRAAGTHFPFAAGTGLVLDGVALDDAPVGNVLCLACYEGTDIYVLAQATIAAGNMLVVDSTDRNKVSGASNTGAALTRQQVGMVYSGNGSTGNLQAVVRI